MDCFWSGWRRLSGNGGGGATRFQRVENRRRSPAAPECSDRSTEPKAFTQRSGLFTEESYAAPSCRLGWDGETGGRSALNIHNPYPKPFSFVFPKATDLKNKTVSSTGSPSQSHGVEFHSEKLWKNKKKKNYEQVRFPQSLCKKEK